MKQYFAKYLPVEGEIKKGTRYRIGKSLGLGAYGEGYIGTAAIDFTPNAQRDQQANIVKLFLCSRDIQVGDEVYAEPQAIDNYSKGLRLQVNDILDHVYLDDLSKKVYKIPILEYISNPSHPQTVGMTREWVMGNLWKVIGEISPEATWIKEGDEFDENEIEAFYYDTRFGTQVGSVKRLGNMNRFVEIKYRIKGPCGRFH